MTKSLYERVLEWENLHGLDGGECYKPYFKDAQMIAKRLGYKPYGSKDGSSFRTLYTDGQVVAVLAGLDAKYGKEEKA